MPLTDWVFLGAAAFCVGLLVWATLQPHRPRRTESGVHAAWAVAVRKPGGEPTWHVVAASGAEAAHRVALRRAGHPAVIVDSYPVVRYPRP